IGYAAGSLALVANRFHMLKDAPPPSSNDAVSLLIALHLIQLTKNNGTSTEYSYDQHRAEILAAFINGVFLLALCFSIFVEVIEKIFLLPTVRSLESVAIVGLLVLVSNMVRLLLF
ncbi:hypothetical protein M407DRAFT_60608, partial [Tulasnella calospora MUT 4182]